MKDVGMKLLVVAICIFAVMSCNKMEQSVKKEPSF
jgi:hypothetical protein